MAKRRMATILAWIFSGMMICACGMLPRFTVHLPDGIVQIEIPDTGKILDKSDFGDLAVIRGSHRMVTVDREVSQFERISIMGSGAITITQGSDHSVSVTIDDNLLEYLQTKVENGTLVLGFDPDKAKRKDLRPSDPIGFDITIPNLSGIEIYGSADIVSENLVLDRFSVDIYDCTAITAP